jgi:bacterial/archaeal transporter family protein
MLHVTRPVDAKQRQLAKELAMHWLLFALISATAAGATAILAKIGVRDVPSELATALRTAVVLVLAFAVVQVRGEWVPLRSLTARTLIFLTLSGLATGVSWLAYFRALQLAPASRVAPIDKLSLPISIALAALVLGERISWQLACGVALMVLGALLTLKG